MDHHADRGARPDRINNQTDPKGMTRYLQQVEAFGARMGVLFGERGGNTREPHGPGCRSPVPALPAPRLPWNPAEVHHIRTGTGVGRRAADTETIPLCPEHHRGHGAGGWAGRHLSGLWRYGTGTAGGNAGDDLGRQVNPPRIIRPVGRTTGELPLVSITRGRSTQTN